MDSLWLARTVECDWRVGCHGRFMVTWRRLFYSADRKWLAFGDWCSMWVASGLLCCQMLHVLTSRYLVRKSKLHSVQPLVQKFPFPPQFRGKWLHWNCTECCSPSWNQKLGAVQPLVQIFCCQVFILFTTARSSPVEIDWAGIALRAVLIQMESKLHSNSTQCRHWCINSHFPPFLHYSEQFSGI